MAEQITWGLLSNTKHVLLWGDRVPVAPHEQGLPRLSTGQEIERAAQQGLTKAKFNSFHGGLTVRQGIQPWGNVITEYALNQGIQTRIPGLACLPYRLVGQPTLDATDHSGDVAANIRGHGANTSLGAQGLRYVYLVKNLVFTDTSLTDPALVELASTAFTDYCTAIEPNAVFNNTAYFAAAYNGDNEDIRGFTDVTSVAYNSGWTTLVALNSGDYVNAMRYMQTLGPGCMVYVGMIGGTNQVWYTLGTATLPATPAKVPLAATAEQISASTTTGGSVDLSVIGVDNSGASSSGGWLRVSGGSVESGTIPPGEASGTAYFGNGNFTAYPRGRRVTGIQLVVAHSEGNSAADYYPRIVRVRAGGSTSVSFSDGTELGTSGTDTYGGSGINGGLNITTDDLSGLVVEISYEARSSSTGSITLTLSDVDVTVTYADDGSSLAFPNGGWQTTPSRAFPNRIAMVAPERTDKTAILVPRKLWLLDFEWDTNSERPVFTPTAPETNMQNIHHAAPYQGGYAITGGDVAGPGKFIRHITGSGQLLNLNMPRWNGKEWRCNHLEVRGSWLIGDMVTTDFTDRQRWLFNNGKWFPDTLWQSLSDDAIAAQPIPFAESTPALQQQQVYSFYPVSNTHIAAQRQYLPEDLDADPRLFDTAQVYSMAYTGNSTEDEYLVLRSHEMEFGPSEARLSLVTADFQGRSVNATGESVRTRIVTDGDTAFALPEITKEFTSAFEHYDIPNYGQAYTTIIHELGLKHTAGEDETPNGAGVLYTSVQQWPTLHRIDIEIDEEKMPPTAIHQFLTDIEALKAERPSQPLTIGDKTYNAVFEGLVYGLKAPARGQVVPSNKVTNLIARFREVAGNA